MKIKGDIKHNFFWILLIFIIVFLVIYSIPLKFGNKECYKEIAINSCEEGYRLGELFPRCLVCSEQDIGFTCIEIKNNTQETREIIYDAYRYKNYRFLLEDHMKCTDKYQYFKKITN